MKYLHPIILIVALLFQTGCVPRHTATPRFDPTGLRHSFVEVGVLEHELERGLLRPVNHGCGGIIALRRGRVYVLTAAHVVDELGEVATGTARHFGILIEDEEKWIWDDVRVEMMAPDETDLAIVSAPITLEQQRILVPLEVSWRVPKLGEIIWSMGSPGWDDRRFFAHRMIAGFCHRDSDCSMCPKDDTCVALDGPLHPGHSGGPVLDADGRLIGAVSFLRFSRGDPAIAFFVHVRSAEEMVRSYARDH